MARMSSVTPVSQRFQRVAVSLAVVVTGYLVYAIAVVPFVEPTVTEAAPPAAPAAAVSRTYSFEKWFAPGSWERQQPKVLETDRGTLVFDDCVALPNGNLELSRCTLICRLPAAAPELERPVILRAERGAELIFDRPLDLTRGQFGKLTGGVLRGSITIDSPPSQPDADDTVHIETESLQIDEDRIWAPGAIHFRYGVSQGQGRDLSIYFDSGEDGLSQSPPRAPLGRLESLELVHLDGFELRMPRSPFNNEVPAAVAPPPADGFATVFVRCEGSFLFHFSSAKATLSEQVEVVHQPPQGLSDTLTCEQLEILFADTRGESATGTSDARAERLLAAQPQRLIASGYPAVLKSPGQDIEAHAERMELAVEVRELLLADRQQVRLQIRKFQLSAPQVRYRFAAEGSLGQLHATGPGRLQGVIQAEQQSLDVEWTDALQLVPQGERSVLTVRTAKRIALEGVGQFRAEHLDVVLHEQSSGPAGEQLQIVLEQLHGAGNVAVDTPRLSARLDEVRLWFREPVEGSAPRVAAEEAAWPAEGSQDAGLARYQLDARQLEAQVLLGEQPAVDRLEVRGEISLREEAGPGQGGLVIQGDSFDLAGAENPVARLVGSPAQAASGGRELMGRVIEVRPHENYIGVQGQGNLAVVFPDNHTGSLPPMQISWAGSMTFDGRTGHFVDEVHARGGQRTEQGDILHFAANGTRLDVTLDRQLNLQRPQSQPPVEVRELVFPDWVVLDSRLFTPGGQLKSWDQMQVRDLTMDTHTGEVQGIGPGWVLHRGQPISQSGTSSVLPEPTGHLQFLRVDFARQMVGNLHHRQVQFEDQIQCLLGLIGQWQQQLTYAGRESLGEQDVLLTCHRLDVVDLGNSGGPDALELRATGNARIFGRSFSGTGNRLSYARGKDLLVLEGDGRQDAVLRFQKAPGVAPVELTVGKVLFYPGTKQWALNDIRSLELPQPGRP